MKLPMIYACPDAVFVSWDDGRTWWELSPAGSATERFRRPPERARRLREPCDKDCCEARTDDRLDRLAAGGKGDDPATRQLAAWRDWARASDARSNDNDDTEGVVRS